PGGQHRPEDDRADQREGTDQFAIALGHVRHLDCCGWDGGGLPLRHPDRYRNIAVNAMQDAAPGQVSYASDRLRPVRVWLYGVAAFVLWIVVVGGITRLTEAGLSITAWKPLSGVIPPLN